MDYAHFGQAVQESLIEKLVGKLDCLSVFLPINFNSAPVLNLESASLE